MPRIQLKPNSAEFADEREKQPQIRHCDMPGCSLTGEYRAPKDRALSDYYRFCLEHVREYNQAWNFFSGMSDSEVESHIVAAQYGHRPTWRYDTNQAEDSLRSKAWQTYNFTDQEPPSSDRNGHAPKNNGPESEALAIMGLQAPVTLDEIKARYKVLAKQHHPDLNRGSAESEELLKSINMAYTILKVAYEQFKELPDRN